MAAKKTRDEIATRCRPRARRDQTRVAASMPTALATSFDALPAHRRSVTRGRPPWRARSMKKRAARRAVMSDGRRAGTLMSSRAEKGGGFSARALSSSRPERELNSTLAAFVASRHARQQGTRARTATSPRAFSLATSASKRTSSSNARRTPWDASRRARRKRRHPAADPPPDAFFFFELFLMRPMASSARSTTTFASTRSWRERTRAARSRCGRACLAAVRAARRRMPRGSNSIRAPDETN